MAKTAEIVENLHMRALVVCHPQLPTVDGARRIGGSRVLQKTPLPGGGAFGHAVILSAQEPSSAAVARAAPPVSGGFEYRVYFADVVLQGFAGLLIAVPMKELFADATPAAVGVRYARYDLHAVLNDQFSGSHDPNVRIASLYARYRGDEKVSSVALFGKDVLTAGVVKDILGERAVSARGGPFGAGSKNGARLEPNSCRLRWDDGAGRPFSLNLDRIGNYSFLLRRADELARVIDLFRYASSVKALVADVEADPTRRSAAALEKVMS
jgi:hypothetical protein